MPDQTGRVNQTVNRNSKELSNFTLNNREFQIPINNYNNNNNNPINNNNKLVLDIQIIVVRDTKVFLITNINCLREKRQKVNTINYYILDL